MSPTRSYTKIDDECIQNVESKKSIFFQLSPRTPSKIQSENSDEGSPFLGFSPQKPYKRISFSKFKISNESEGSQSLDALRRSPSKTQSPKSSKGSPFLGFSPQSVFKSKTANPSNASEDFLGFTPLVSSTPKRKSVELPMTPLPSKRNSMHSLSLIARDSNLSHTSSISCSALYDIEKHSYLRKPNSESSVSSTSFEDDESSNAQFFSIKQLYARCEYDYLKSQHGCCCISVVALLYSVHSIIYYWDASDLEAILDTGYLYFNETQLLHGQQISHVKPTDLVRSLTMFGKCYDVDIGKLNYVGRIDEDDFTLGFNYLDEMGCQLGILIINDLSYGIVVCRFAEDVEYVLFDCHGRSWNGGRFGEYCCVLFFANVKLLISQLLADFNGSENFELYVVNFRFAFHVGEGAHSLQQAPSLHSSEEVIVDETLASRTPPSPTKPQPQQQNFPLLPGQLFYKNIYGNFCQSSDIFPEPLHQCTAMSAAALAYNLIKPVGNWNGQDLDNVLIGGQFNINHIDLEYGYVSNSQSYLEAIALTPYLEVGGFSFTVSVSNDDLRGGFHDDVSTITNAIANFASKKYDAGIITYRTYSYGLLRCARENSTSSSYVFLDSHGRDCNGRRPGNFSVILFFNTATDFILFYLSEFPLLQKQAVVNEGDLSRMLILVPLMITRNNVRNCDINSLPLDVNCEQQVVENVCDTDCNAVTPIGCSTVLVDSSPVTGDVTSTLLREKRDSQQYDVIPYHLYAKERYYDIAISSDTESNRMPHTNLCVVSSVFGLIYDAYVCPVDVWDESDLDSIFEQSCAAYDYPCEILQETGVNSPPSDIFDLPKEFEFSTGATFTLIPESGRLEAVTVHQLDKIIKRFSISSSKYGILTVCGETYAVFKCSKGNRGRYALYDIHGRTEDAGKIGKELEMLSAVIYFTDVWQLLRLLLDENEVGFLFNFYPIKIWRTKLFHKIISGRIAQNDQSFNICSRDKQCTANSVVFLAYTSLIENNWTKTDIDRILYVGDHIYAISYPKAVQQRPTKDPHPYISAGEVHRKIVITTDGSRANEITVICEPVMELSRPFGEFAYDYMKRFFSKQIYGVFISSSKSVALYRFDSTYVLFDPHARNAYGMYDKKGTANIFFFETIEQIYDFLCLEGYAANKEFTLTAFTFTKEKKSDKIPQISIPIVNLDNWQVPVRDEDFDSDDDIPLQDLLNVEWSPDDNIPLIHLKAADGAFDSKEMPLVSRKCVSRSVTSETLTMRTLPLLKPDGCASTVTSTQTGKRDGSSYKRPHDVLRLQRLRDMRHNVRKQKTFVMLPAEEQAIHRRWHNYLNRCQRTKLPSHYRNAAEYAEAIVNYKKYLEDATDDQELIKVADAAVETVVRNEERIRQRISNREQNPTHFLAYCNLDNVNENDAIYNQYRLGLMDQVCVHCKALYWRQEKNARGVYTGCCNSGTHHHNLPEELNNTYPHIFRNLLDGTSMLSREFMENIMRYNNVFSFGSLGASDFSCMDRSGRLGPAVVVDGMIYHNAEMFRTNSNGQDLPPAQLYYISNAAAVAERNRLSDVPLNVGLVMLIENFLRANNPYVGAFRMLTEVLREVRNRPNAPPTNVNLRIFELRHREQVEIRRNHGGDFSVPTMNEVAAVFTEPPPPGTKNIVIFPTDEPVEGGVAIGSSNPNRDSYLYPLLFPFGEQSWSHRLYRDFVYDGPNARSRVTARDFYAYLLKERENMFNPVLNAGKLTQQFIIDCWSRVQENQMEYQKSEEGQAKLRVETYGALKDYIENSNLFKPDMPGRVIPMPSEFVGSRKYIREKYLDAMAVCSKYKRPTYFITLTCNPFSKDITENIPKGANPINHSVVTSRAFQCMVDEMVDDLKKKQILGVCEGIIYVIEWQKRSNHHCHFIVFIQDEDRPANAIDIDNVVSAEIPCPLTQPRLYRAVTTMMYHEQCGPGTNAKCMVPRKVGVGKECRKHFPKKFVEATVMNEGNSPVYRRRNNGRTFTTAKGNVLDNRWIVPYNPFLLLKYDCHLNVEVVSTVEVLKYLFKYFFKSFDMSKIMLEIIDGEQVYDEFQHYLDCRHLSAMESYWRIASFPVHYNDHTVYRLPVHLENYQRVIVRPGNDVGEALARSGSELLAYFQLNQVDTNARQYLYTEIPYHYVYDPKRKAWHTRQRTNKPLVTRLYGVNYNQMELYALRLLLLTVRGATSYEEIRNVRGTQYDSFHGAAVALGLLTDDDMQKRTFEEVIYVEMPHHIRCLFANMLIFITPNNPLEFWNKYKSKMCEDYVRRRMSTDMAEQLALRHISSLLSFAGFTNTEMKLPEPNFRNATEQQQADAIASEYLNNQFDAIEEAAIGRRLMATLNGEQKSFFDRIMHCVNADAQKLFFLDGPGGTGKTFVNRTILCTLRGMGKKCTVVVWTGMGASLYKGGRTVHSTFRLPFDIDGSITCNVTTTSDIGAQLRQTDVLIWDEISMVNKNAFNAVDTLMRDLKEKRNEPFGGIMVITSGDFRQTLPIMPRASRSQIINNLVKRSNVWDKFEKHALRTNMRLENPDDAAFATWLLDVGDGKLKDYPPNEYYGSYVKIPEECVSPASLVESIYGQTFNSSDIRQYCQHVILSTHHEDVDMLNNLIYNRMSEDVCTEKTYYSTDDISNQDPHAREQFDTTVLNGLNPKGTAPHKLKLTVNSIIMLLRNLNPYDGFSNGTRLLVKKLYDNCIVGEIISGENAGKEILIPRTRMTAKVESISEELIRIQFPVKLCFAMTIDKSQSQSFTSVGLFLRKPVFSHGQLYVALSRTRHKANLKVQVYSDSLMGKLNVDSDDIYVPNIVYREAL